MSDKKQELFILLLWWSMFLIFYCGGPSSWSLMWWSMFLIFYCGGPCSWSFLSFLCCELFLIIFVLCLVLPVSLDCPFLIAPSVFCVVFCLSSFCVLCSMFHVSLDCPFLIIVSVFFNVYLSFIVLPL
jgi:hypothetical protein